MARLTGTDSRTKVLCDLVRLKSNRHRRVFFSKLFAWNTFRGRWEQNAETRKVTMDITSLIIEAVSGAVGGNVAGAAMKEKSLGAVGNSLAGLVGGGLGGTILQAIMGSAASGGGGMDMQSILANVGGGGVGGAILMAIIGIIKAQMAKSG